VAASTVEAAGAVLPVGAAIAAGAMAGAVAVPVLGTVAPKPTAGDEPGGASGMDARCENLEPAPPAKGDGVPDADAAEEPARSDPDPNADKALPNGEASLEAPAAVANRPAAQDEDANPVDPTVNDPDPNVGNRLPEAGVAFAAVPDVAANSPPELDEEEAIPVAPTVDDPDPNVGTKLPDAGDALVAVPAADANSPAVLGEDDDIAVAPAVDDPDPNVGSVGNRLPSDRGASVAEAPGNAVVLAEDDPVPASAGPPGPDADKKLDPKAPPPKRPESPALAGALVDEDGFVSARTSALSCAVVPLSSPVCFCAFAASASTDCCAPSCSEACTCACFSGLACDRVTSGAIPVSDRSPRAASVAKTSSRSATAPAEPGQGPDDLFAVYALAVNSHIAAGPSTGLPKSRNGSSKKSSGALIMRLLGLRR